MQAIDLIDEAGSRVRLQHAQLPEEARELDKELRALNKEKDAAVRGQDFEKAGNVSSFLHLTNRRPLTQFFIPGRAAYLTTISYLLVDFSKSF